jgi:hypothetical protein
MFEDIVEELHNLEVEYYFVDIYILVEVGNLVALLIVGNYNLVVVDMD